MSIDAAIVRDAAGLLELLSTELDAMRNELEELGARLCADPAVVRGHMAELQALDEIGQRSACLAAILRAPDMVEASRSVRLEGLAARLQG